MRVNLFVGLILAAIGFLVFSHLLQADFVYWDDRKIYLTNPQVLSFDVAGIFTNMSLGGYYPLTQLSLALDHFLFGENSSALHAVNLGLHGINTYLVYLIGGSVFGFSELLALALAALFALHPLNVETVAWITGGRKDLLCTLFYLASLLAFEKSLRFKARRWGLVTVLLGAIALLCKAPAVTLPFVLLVRAWSSKKREGLRTATIWPTLILIPGTLILAYFENLAQKTSQHLMVTDFSFWQGLKNAVGSLYFLLSHALWPRGLAVFYDPAVFRFDAWDTLLGGGFVLFGIYTCVRVRPSRATLILFFLTVAPVLKLIPFGQDTVFNDRYFYLPGIFLMAFFIEGAVAVLRERVCLSFLLVVAGLFAWTARAQTLVWTNQESLWLNVLAYYPNTTKAYQNLSLYYIEKARYEEALGTMLSSLRIQPHDPQVRLNLGVLYTRMGRLQDAQASYEDSLKMWPTDVILLNNLGFVYMQQKDYPKARSTYEAALRIDPTFANAVAGLRESQDALKGSVPP